MRPLNVWLLSRKPINQGAKEAQHYQTDENKRLMRTSPNTSGKHFISDFQGEFSIPNRLNSYSTFLCVWPSLFLIIFDILSIILDPWRKVMSLLMWKVKRTKIVLRCQKQLNRMILLTINSIKDPIKPLATTCVTAEISSLAIKAN